MGRLFAKEARPKDAVPAWCRCGSALNQVRM
jgi:hypothetical protein